MYKYENLKPGIFTMGVAMSGTGDSWKRMACVDRLTELGELKEIKYGECAGQHRIFVDPNSR